MHAHVSKHESQYNSKAVAFIVDRIVPCTRNATQHQQLIRHHWTPLSGGVSARLHLAVGTVYNCMTMLKTHNSHAIMTVVILKLSNGNANANGERSGVASPSRVRQRSSPRRRVVVCSQALSWIHGACHAHGSWVEDLNFALAHNPLPLRGTS